MYNIYISCIMRSYYCATRPVKQNNRLRARARRCTIGNNNSNNNCPTTMPLVYYTDDRAIAAPAEQLLCKCSANPTDYYVCIIFFLFLSIFGLCSSHYHHILFITPYRNIVRYCTGAARRRPSAVEHRGRLV